MAKKTGKAKSPGKLPPTGKPSGIQLSERELAQAKGGAKHIANVKYEP